MRWSSFSEDVVKTTSLDDFYEVSVCDSYKDPSCTEAGYPWMPNSGGMQVRVVAFLKEFSWLLLKQAANLIQQVIGFIRIHLEKTMYVVSFEPFWFWIHSWLKEILKLFKNFALTLSFSLPPLPLCFLSSVPCYAHKKLQIWDTAGQERFRSITQSYYRSANALILTYDITCEESFRCLPEWLREIEQYASNKVITVLVGKCHWGLFGKERTL